MRNYEIMFIVNPNATDEEIDKINGQIENIVTTGGGKVEKLEKMGKRRLAYNVEKQREGYYVLFVLEANGDIIKECERRLRVMDAVMKYLTVRTDEVERGINKLKNFRQRRAERRGSSRGSGAAGQSIEEAMQ